MDHLVHAKEALKRLPTISCITIMTMCVETRGNLLNQRVVGGVAYIDIPSPPCSTHTDDRCLSTNRFLDEMFPSRPTIVE